MTDIVSKELNDKLKQAVKEKFLDLIDENSLSKFVDEVVRDQEQSIKLAVDTIIKEQIGEYVTKYLKEKASVNWDGYRNQYDATIVSAIQQTVPRVFEEFLGSMLSNAIQNYSNRGY